MEGAFSLLAVAEEVVLRLPLDDAYDTIAIMKHSTEKTYIWDLDGTLLDSYEVIVSSVLDACRSFGLCVMEEEAHRQVIRHSVTFYLQSVAESRGLPFDVLMTRYSEISGQRKDEIRAMPHAKEVLEALRGQGGCHFVYTHRGKTTNEVLERLGFGAFFAETVTSQNSFPRKPAPDAIRYLIQKYRLDPKTAFYVGDRTIDMDCAKNAGVQGILFLPAGSYCTPNGSEKRIISDLRDLL